MLASIGRLFHSFPFPWSFDFPLGFCFVIMLHYYSLSHAMRSYSPVSWSRISEPCTVLNVITIFLLRCSRSYLLILLHLPSKHCRKIPRMTLRKIINQCNFPTKKLMYSVLCYRRGIDNSVAPGVSMYLNMYLGITMTTSKDDM